MDYIHSMLWAYEERMYKGILSSLCERYLICCGEVDIWSRLYYTHINEINKKKLIYLNINISHTQDKSSVSSKRRSHRYSLRKKAISSLLIKNTSSQHRRYTELRNSIVISTILLPSSSQTSTFNASRSQEQLLRALRSVQTDRRLYRINLHCDGAGGIFKCRKCLEMRTETYCDRT